MTEHKVESQSAFTAARTAFSRQVTLTCTCGGRFTGHCTGKRGDESKRLKVRALEAAEQVFRKHIPIR